MHKVIQLGLKEVKEGLLIHKVAQDQAAHPRETKEMESTILISIIIIQTMLKPHPTRTVINKLLIHLTDLNKLKLAKEFKFGILIKNNSNKFKIK
jgi:hypothetical protein